MRRMENKVWKKREKNSFIGLEYVFFLFCHEGNPQILFFWFNCAFLVHIRGGVDT